MYILRKSISNIHDMTGVENEEISLVTSFLVRWRYKSKLFLGIKVTDQSFKMLLFSPIPSFTSAQATRRQEKD